MKINGQNFFTDLCFGEYRWSGFIVITVKKFDVDQFLGLFLVVLRDHSCVVFTEQTQMNHERRVLKHKTKTAVIIDIHVKSIMVR